MYTALMNKKSLLVIGLITMLGLTGCFGGDNETIISGQEVIAGTKKVYETEQFGITIPLDWEAIGKEDHTSNVPSGTVVAFVNNIKSDRFTANVSVHITQFTEEGVILEDFAKSAMDQARNTLTEFSEGSMEEVKISFGEEESTNGFLLTFSGKKSATDPIIEWKQLVVLANEVGYTISGAYINSEEESVVKQVDEMLNSFSLN